MTISSLQTTVAVTPLHAQDLPQATVLATSLALSLVTAEQLALNLAYTFLLVVDGDRVALRPAYGHAFGEITVDFFSGANAYRRKHGGAGQDIARAVGVIHGIRPHVLDACAGLGRDAFVLATLGCNVVLVERNPVVYALLENGLARGHRQAHENNDEQLLAALSRMLLIPADSHEVIATLVTTHNIEVIYLDPMFPERRKVAAVKKEMAAFHALVGEDADAAVLLRQALSCDVCRVVVKRPRLAALLDGKSPSHQIIGKSTRYDVHVRRALTRPDS